MLSRWLAFVVWALLGATVVTVLLQMLAQPSPVPAHAIPVDTTASFRTELTRLFGAAKPVAAEAAAARGDDRLKLIGLVASSSPSERGSSVAVIAMEGKPPKSYRVGAVIDGDRQILAVRKGAVDIGPQGGPVAFTLTLPGLPPPATGTPSAAGGAVPTMAPGAMPVGMPPSEAPPPPPPEAPQPQIQQPAVPPPPIEAQPVAPPPSPPAQPG
jgi:general secretion pathway protein C